MTTYIACAFRGLAETNSLSRFPYAPFEIPAPARILLTYLAAKAIQLDHGVWPIDVERELGLPWDVVEELLDDLVKAGSVLLIPRPNDLTVIGVLYMNGEDEDGWDKWAR